MVTRMLEWPSRSMTMRGWVPCFSMNVAEA